MTIDPGFSALDPRRAICFLPLDGQFRQDVGANLFVNGDFEAGTTGWWSLDATLSVEPGGFGSQYLKITATNPTFWAGQDCQPIGKYVHETGYAKGDGAASVTVLQNSLPIWTGTASVVWQAYDLAFLATGAQARIGSNSATGAVYFDNCDMREYPQVTRNLSLVTGANNYARIGDGHTSTTFPNQKAGRGLTFDGGDYVNLDWSAGSPLDTQTFTVVALVQPTVPTADGRIYEIGIAGQRYSLYYDLSDGNIVWQKDDTVDQTIVSGWGGAQWGQPFVVAASISSTGMRLMIDDQVMGAIAGDVRLASFNAASKAYFGQDVAGGNLYKGGLYGAAVYPFELTEVQVREAGRRMKQLRNV